MGSALNFLIPHKMSLENLEFKYHGNWGGPNYSAAKFGNKDIDWNVKSIDSLDEVFKKHDYDYTRMDHVDADEIMQRNLTELPFSLKRVLAQQGFKIKNLMNKPGKYQKVSYPWEVASARTSGDAIKLEMKKSGTKKKGPPPRGGAMQSHRRKMAAKNSASKVNPMNPPLIYGQRSSTRQTNPYRFLTGRGRGGFRGRRRRFLKRRTGGWGYPGGGRVPSGGSTVVPIKGWYDQVTAYYPTMNNSTNWVLMGTGGVLSSDVTFAPQNAIYMLPSTVSIANAYEYYRVLKWRMTYKSSLATVTPGEILMWSTRDTNEPYAKGAIQLIGGNYYIAQNLAANNPAGNPLLNIVKAWRNAKQSSPWLPASHNVEIDRRWKRCPNIKGMPSGTILQYNLTENAQIVNSIAGSFVMNGTMLDGQSFTSDQYQRKIGDIYIDAVVEFKQFGPPAVYPDDSFKDAIEDKKISDMVERVCNKLKIEEDKKIEQIYSDMKLEEKARPRSVSSDIEDQGEAYIEILRHGPASKKKSTSIKSEPGRKIGSEPGL